jgi:hypothetical protein
VAFGDTAFEAAVVEEAEGFGRAKTLIFAGRFVLLDDSRTAFARFDFDLVVAMRLSLGTTTASCAATDTAPPKGGRGERVKNGRYSRESRFSSEAASCRRPAS